LRADGPRANDAGANPQEEHTELTLPGVVCSNTPAFLCVWVPENVVSASRQYDLWRYATFLLWFVLFLAGLVPEPVFLLLRQAGGVLTQRAIVNSPNALTVALAGYVVLFVYHRCRDVDDSPGAAQDKALQMGVVALLAFMPVDLGSVLAAHKAPVLAQRLMLYGAALFKLMAWWSLLALFVRYYLFRGDRAFAEIASLFPSTRHKVTQRPIETADRDGAVSENQHEE